MSWLSQQAADVEAESAAQAAAAAAAADEDSKAHSVGLGLHIRGRTALYEGLTDEDDPARFAYHNELSMAARSGEPGDAERVVDQMAAEGFVPGPRAYHALVLSHVRARDSEGALGAIRRCWDAGVTPLPETYAAVVAAHVAAGDLETAEAVFASNRRAGVDCAKSWQQLVAALLQAGQDEQAMALVKQGMSEGMELGEGVCAALLRILCSRQELELAADVVSIIKASEMRLGLDQLEPLIDAHLQRGEPDAAFAYLQEVGERSPAATDAFYRVFEALLASCTSLAEVQAQVQRFRGQAVAAQPGVRFIVAQMAALLRLHEAQAAMQSFRAFQSRSLNRGGLALLQDDLLGGLLLELSRADLPSELYEVMAVMCRAGRPLPALALQPDDAAGGCTVLGAWVRRRLDALAALQQPEPDSEAAAAADEAAALLPGLSLGGDAPAPTLDIDGVSVDPLQLCAVDGGGAPLAVSRMTVRELRAELAARRAPVAGNKKELARRVQKLRQLDGTRSATTGPMLRPRSDKKAGDGGGKVEKVLTEFVFVQGSEASNAEQRVVEEAEEAEEEGEAPEWDMAEEEEGASSRRRGEGEEDEGSLFDDDDDAAAWVDAQLPPDNFVLSTSPPFSSALAGPHEAAAMLLGAVHNMGAQPSAADVEAVGSYVLGAADVPAAVLLAGALQRLPQPLPGSEELRAQLLALCEGAGVGAEVALTEVLGEREGEAAEVARADDAQREIAGMFAELGL